MIVTTTYRRKTFVVQASQVSEGNMDALSDWCGGEFVESYRPTFDMPGIHRIGHPCIELTVARNGRKIRAFVGDWITNIAGTDKFKVYHDKTFKEAFEEVLRDFPEEMMRRIVREEMRHLLQSVTRTANGLYTGLGAYDIGDLERAGHRAIEKVMGLEEAMLPHAWNCNLRDPQEYDSSGEKFKCSCGVGNDS